jgi:uncharacterized lipoprotein YajG
MKKLIILSALAILASCSTTTSSTDLQKQDSIHCDYQDSTPCNCITSKELSTDSIK